MGIYSTILFTSIFVFTLLVCTVECSHIHTWAFGLQMLWQTFWHLFVQYRERYLHEPASSSYMISFTTLLGGPLFSYSRFVSQMTKAGFNPPPNPLGVVFRKLMQVLLLECVKILLGLDSGKIQLENSKIGADSRMEISGPLRLRAACQSLPVGGTPPQLPGYAD
ncbi:uncharacterized protein V6R79_017474 [Siganus canaliculatus]